MNDKYKKKEILTQFEDILWVLTFFFFEMILKRRGHFLKPSFPLESIKKQNKQKQFF